ncbi:MAG: hypothetical protein Q7T62_16000 [Undibacterium sp.]|nr:hypothetical protein [Undibacterium sp.]
MRLSNKMLVVTGAGLFSLMCGTAQADGLTDLKAALTRLQGQAPLKAVIEAKTWNRQGEGSEQVETNGLASVAVDDGARGLQVLYSKDMLARLEVEEHAKEKNAKTKTPTLSAFKEFNSTELRPMISASGGMLRALEKHVFKSEKMESYNGKPARLLNFDLPLERLPEDARKYVKKFEGSLDIWIAADGTPLASRSHQNMSGRAFVVVSFEQKNENESVYSQVGDRLLTVRKETKSSGSGMGEKGESKVVKTLLVQS